MIEYDCQRCGILVVFFSGLEPPDRLCLECRIIEGLPTESEKREFSRIFAKAYPPDPTQHAQPQED